MEVARDDLGRAARKRGIEGQVTIIRHFGIRCIGRVDKKYVTYFFIVVDNITLSSIYLELDVVRP